MSSGIYSSLSLLLSEDTDHAVLGVASDSLSDSSESSESSEEDEAFEQELKAAPWGYGQPIDIFFVIAQLKRHGLHREAKWLLDEWAVLTHR